MALKLSLNLGDVASKLGLDLSHVAFKPKPHMPSAFKPKLTPYHMASKSSLNLGHIVPRPYLWPCHVTFSS
jgi:hypothetical protein